MKTKKQSLLNGSIFRMLGMLLTMLISPFLSKAVEPDTCRLGGDITHLNAQNEEFRSNDACKSKWISVSGCGDSYTIDINSDGHTNTYQLVETAGGQCWFQQNLKEVPSKFQLKRSLWANSADRGSFGFYNKEDYFGAWEEAEPAANEGMLYQWSAAMNGQIAERAQGACPKGFHVPSDCEWMFLEHNMGMTTRSQKTTGLRGKETRVGENMKTGTPVEFMPLFTGYRYPATGAFVERGTHAYWWTSSANGGNAFFRYLENGSHNIYRYWYAKAYAFSLRCLKD